MSPESLTNRADRYPLAASRLLRERPLIVSEAAQAQFAATQRDMRTEYRYFGQNTHYRWKGHMAAVRSTTPLPPGRRVLDIGAGHGEYVKAVAEQGHHAIGITAYDYSHGTNPCLIVADAQEFGVHLPPGETAFDLVVSRWTLRHLADPFSCLEQMLNATALGGEIITDDFHFPANASQPAIGKLVIGHLLAHGFEGASSMSEAWLETIARSSLGATLMPGLHLVRRGTEEVRLPIIHRCDETGWTVEPRYDETVGFDTFTK